MATVKICDRCGAEINPKSSLTYVHMLDSTLERLQEKELCVSCAFKLREWLVKDGEGADETESNENDRWKTADDGDGVVCPKCGEDFCTLIHETGRFKHCPNCGKPLKPQLGGVV